MLALASAQDIKKKSIKLTWILIFSILAIVIHIFFGEESIVNLLLGIIPGAGLMLVSLATRRNMELFLTGLMLCAIWALALIIIRKKKGDYEIPFVPFLLAAYMEMLIAGAIMGL